MITFTNKFFEVFFVEWGFISIISSLIAFGMCLTKKTKYLNIAYWLSLFSAILVLGLIGCAWVKLI